VILEARGLTVRYAGATAPALQDVSFALQPGELVAMAGPNGSGKTTLVRTLLGVQRAERGEALLDGRSVASWSRAEMARIVAVMPQREETTFPLTVEESVLLGRYPHLGPVAPVRPADHAAVRTALERCDVWSLRTRTTESLSGGEWQRVRVARALAQEPRALVLDEPTAALDVRHEMELFELVLTLVREGLAALVVTHHLNIAARFADRVVLLSHGRIVAQGAPAEVLRGDVVSAVFEWPVAVTQWCDGSPQIVPLRSHEVIPESSRPSLPGVSPQ
jgi:iron complex transport system ATP-binding protein